MKTRSSAVVGTAALALFLAIGGCRSVITSDAGAPPFPPNLPTEITTASGLVFRASGEVIDTGPTVLRITATVTNPTGSDVTAAILEEECELIVVANWQRSPFIRLVQPLDGGGRSTGVLGVCGTRTASRVIAAGETVTLTKEEDLVLSDLLGPTFEPGRFIISAIYVDQFIYEVIALDLQIVD